MRLRSQLVVAFLLLGALPLAGLVGFNYRSSIRAFHRAVEVAAAGEAAEMERRMTEVTGDLRRRVVGLGNLPVAEALAARDTEAARRMRGAVLATLGPTAPWVETLELVPVPGAAPRPPGTPEPAVAPEPAVPAEPAVPPEPAVAPVAPDPSPPPLVLDVGELVAQSIDLEAEVELEGITDPAEQRRARAGIAIARSVATLLEGLRVPVPATAPLPGDPAGAPLGDAFARSLELPIVHEGGRAFRLLPRINTEALLARVLSRTRRDQGELPFALDQDGKLYVAAEADREPLARALAAAPTGRAPASRWVSDDWVVVTSPSGVEGVVLGIARPIRAELEGIRAAAVRNLGWGLAILAVVMLGVLPLSRLATEVERKTTELEEARRFQLSLLPKTLPRHPRYRLSVRMQTATEVGGDYYDVRQDGDVLTLAVGDATGHGAKAGTMVTVVKSLFMAGGGRASPAAFLAEATRTVRRMELGRMAMALVVARLDERGMTVSAAGMPPVFVYRRGDGTVEEVALPGMPLGGVEDFPYQERWLPLAEGDVALFLSDGLPELPAPGGDVLGYGRVGERFAALAAGGAEAVVAGLLALVAERTGKVDPADDVTLFALEVLGAADGAG